MNEPELKAFLAEITPADQDAIKKAKDRQISLAKPPGSLGRLEDIAVKLSGITGKLHNKLEKKRIIVMCADNGVTGEGVSTTPMIVTLSQAMNMTRHLTGMSALAKYFGNEVEVVDVGINQEYTHPLILNRSIAKGTRNLYKEPAMTRDQALQAIGVGIERAMAAKKDGIDAIGTGEMGISNTTTSAAVLSALTGLTVEDVTGRGAGLTDKGFEKKKQVIKTALEMHKPDPKDPIDVLSKVGGFDLCAMCGTFLGAAHEKLPVVIDGYISIVAALCAKRLCPDAADYMFPSHSSYEIGYLKASKELGLEPYLNLGMRLGEGSGCPLAFMIMDAACAFTTNMATFEEAAINDDYLDELLAGDSFTVKK